MYTDISDENIDGLVLSIHVKNFFCHGNFFIDFQDEKNRNIQSVVGRNGSGKSAVLTALIVGLGGRASDTSRGSNLQSFIKDGANTATIEIKIKNSSPKAYKPEIYGDSITIVRTITASGGSYKFKNHAGEEKSTRGSDINAITMYHDIQVDNPISVLNQDDARTLHGKDGKAKYTLFRRATHFDQTEAYYDRALENCHKAKDIWKRKNEAFEKITQNHKRLENLYNQLKPRAEIEAQKKALQDEIKWCDIVDFEHEAKDIHESCEKQRSKCQNLANKLKLMVENCGSGNGQLEDLKKRLLEPQSRRGELERVLREAEAARRSADESLHQARNLHGHMTTKRNREQGKATDLQREIQNIESGDNNSGLRREALERELSERRSASEETRARHETAQHQEQMATEQAARAEREYDDFRTQNSGQQRQIELLRNRLREMSAQTSDSLSVFGSAMVELCSRIQRDVQTGGFREAPRGPIGSYIKVKDKQWAGALEHLLDGCMFNFCVNEARDSKRIFELMGEVWRHSGRKPGVTCSGFRGKVQDVSARRASAPGAVCALDALDISDPVVANYLINNLDLETVLLVPNHDDAVRLTVNANNVPANCSKVVTMDCSEYFPAPRYRIYGGQPRNPRYLSASVGDRTRQLEMKISELQGTMSSNKATEARLASAVKEARKQQEKAGRELQALQSALRQCERAVAETEEALQQHATPQRAVLEEEYEICKAKIIKLDEEVGKLSEKLLLCEQTKEESTKRARDIKTELEQVNKEYRDLKEELDQKQLSMERGATERASYKQRVKEEHDKLKRVEQVWEEKVAELEAKRAGLGERPEVIRLKSELHNQLRQIEQKLIALASRNISREQVHSDLVKVTQRKNFVEKELKTLKALIGEIEKITTKHRDLCYKLQIDIGRRVQICFITTLRLKKYEGHLDLDHSSRTLDIKLAGKTTGTLSGGERSYCSMALIMALWECVELPFYFMDEFDVFMDNVNREIVWQLLVGFAARRPGRQFVFLTPQELPVASNKIVVHSLDDPTRLRN